MPRRLSSGSIVLAALAWAGAAPAVPLVPVAQDRAVSVEIDVSTTLVVGPPPSPGETTVVSYDDSASAPDFGPFDARADVPGFGATSASQTSSIGTFLVSASGSHAAFASGSFDTGPPGVLVLESHATESRFSITFSLSEATAFSLVGSVSTSGGFTSGSQSHIALTGPGAVGIASVAVASDPDCLDPSCFEVGPAPLDVSGVLAAGSYVLEAAASGTAASLFSPSFGVIPGAHAGSYELALRLVPEASARALLLVGALGLALRWRGVGRADTTTRKLGR